MALVGQSRIVAFILALLAAAAAKPQPTAVRLISGTKLTRTLDPAATDRFVFEVDAGKFARVVVNQIGSDVVVTLRDAAQNVLMVSDLPNGEVGPETVAVVSRSAGDYTVEVTLHETVHANGSFEVLLEPLREAIPSDDGLLAAYRGLREAYVLRNKHSADARAQAMTILLQIRPSFRVSGDKYSEAWTAMMMASMQAESGDTGAALPSAREAAGLFHDARDNSGEANGWNVAAGLLDILGQPDDALELFRRALTLSRAAGNPVQEARVLNNIGAIQTDLGDQQGALDSFQQALRIARDDGNIRNQALLTKNIGATLLRLGDADEAIARFEQALALWREAGDRSGEADTLLAIGRAWDASNQPEKGRDYLERALTLQIAIGNRRKEAVIRLNVGQVDVALGRISEADASFRQAMEGARAAHDRRYTALAMLYLSQVLTLQKQPATAFQQAIEALTEFQALGDRNSEASALEAMARAENASGDLVSARQHIEQALLISEASRTSADSEQLRASFFATRQSAYRFYIDLLMRSGGADDLALEVNERSRARSLLEMLAASGGDLREGVDAKLLAREREITNLLNAKGARLLPMAANSPQANELTQEIRALESEYQDVEAAIRKSSPRYAAVTQPSVLTAKQIQAQVLDADTLLLEYSLGDERSYLWVAGKDSLRSYQLPARARIEEQARKVSQLLSVRADAPLRAAAAELGSMVLGDAAGTLGDKRLVIVPDGALQSIPFSMLTNPRTRLPLVAHNEIVMTPSASAVAALRAQVSGRKPAPKMMAVFADPVFDASDPRSGGAIAKNALPSSDSRVLEHLAGESTAGSLKIPRLPYTAQEAERILRIAPDHSDLKAVGFDASRATAISGQLSDYRYLHFATHGYLDTERPALSALVLSQINAQHNPEDGFLRVNDIYNARLSADLVVLSACQTGLGKDVRGEGLMGLTRAFLYAGVPRVVVSLWNVNDLATAQLMADFYERMLRRGKRPSEALREAQLELRKQKRWESPYYWAAFVQQGDWI